MAQRLWTVVVCAFGQPPARLSHRSGSPAFAPCSSISLARLTRPVRSQRSGATSSVVSLPYSWLSGPPSAFGSRTISNPAFRSSASIPAASFATSPRACFSTAATRRRMISSSSRSGGILHSRYVRAGLYRRRTRGGYAGDPRRDRSRPLCPVTPGQAAQERSREARSYFSRADGHPIPAAEAGRATELCVRQAERRPATAIAWAWTRWLTYQRTAGAMLDEQ